MARTGKFGGFEFDEEVFAGMMTEADHWATPIILSGIIQEDQSVMDLIGTKGNVATIPMYNPLDADDEGMEPLNNDGDTNNEPAEITGSKQTCMLIQRMKAFKAKDFTKELTGADPLTHVRNKIQGYYNQVWENELMNISNAVMKVPALSSHVLDLKEGAIEVGTIYDAEQAALGDMAGKMGMVVLHSMIFKEYQKMGLVGTMVFAHPYALEKTVELPVINGKIAMVTDRNTFAGSGVYNTYLFGEGAFISCSKKNYEKQYYTDYDPVTSAGTERFFTKQGKVLHPNGVSLNVDNITKESPTKLELGTHTNWDLKFNSKNVRIGVIKSKVGVPLV